MTDPKQEAFLNNIASKLGRERKSGVKPPKWDIQPYEHLYRGKSQEDLIQQFITNLNGLNTEVDRIDRQQLNASLKKVIQKFSIRSAVCWDDPSLQELGLEEILSDEGVKCVRWNKEADQADLRQAAATADLGIAFADMGLAEAGTVLLMNGGGRGRPVSVLPPAFLCILNESQIRPRLTQAVEYIGSKVSEGLPACINFITGPSRTGDIEMDLALGVHGPGKVHVILLKD